MSTSLFSANSNEIQEGFPRIQVPGVYKCIIKNVSGEGWESKKGNQIENPIIMTFLIRDEDGNKYEHQAVEFAPTEQDEDKKTHNKVLRLVHIVSKVTGKKFEINASDWEGVHKQVIDALTPHAGEGKSPILWLKLVGNVYNKNANIQYPGYTGFINRDDEDKKPTMSRNEIAENNKYLAEVSKTQADEEEDEGFGGVGTGEEDEGLDDAEDDGDPMF